MSHSNWVARAEVALGLLLFLLLGLPVFANQEQKNRAAAATLPDQLDENHGTKLEFKPIGAYLESGLLTNSVLRLYVDIRGPLADSKVLRIELKEPRANTVFAEASFRPPEDLSPVHTRAYLMSFPVNSAAANQLITGGRLLVRLAEQQPQEVPIVHRDDGRSLTNLLMSLLSLSGFGFVVAAIWRQRRWLRFVGGSAAELSTSTQTSIALFAVCLLLLLPFLLTLFWTTFLQRFTLQTLDAFKFANAAIVPSVATFIFVRSYQSTKLIADVWGGKLTEIDRLTKRLQSGWKASAAAVAAGALVTLIYTSLANSPSNTVPAPAMATPLLEQR